MLNKIFLILLAVALATSLATPFIDTTQAVTVSITFTGPIDEVTSSTLQYDNGSYAVCAVTVYFKYISNNTAAGFQIANITNSQNFICNYSNTAIVPTYFDFIVTDNTVSPAVTYQRQHYYQSSDSGELFTVYFGVDQLNYVVNFLDYVGMLETYPYLEARLPVDFAEKTVERRQFDVQNSVILGLRLNTRYSLYLSDGTTSIYYGDLTTTATIGIQLVLRGVDFPKETLLLYQYVHAYTTRNFTLSTLTVNYEDLTNNTNTVTIVITNATSGETTFAQVFTSQSFVFPYAADNSTSYDVLVTIDHATYGSFYYKQYLPGEYTKASEPFSLDFLGSTTTGISTAILLPALLIIFVAGCFSELTSEAAAVLTVVVAIILSALGFIEISQGAIISALALAVMAGIVTARKRMQYS